MCTYDIWLFKTLLAAKEYHIQVYNSKKYVNEVTILIGSKLKNPLHKSSQEYYSYEL